MMSIEKEKETSVLTDFLRMKKIFVRQTVSISYCMNRSYLSGLTEPAWFLFEGVPSPSHRRPCLYFENASIVLLWYKHSELFYIHTNTATQEGQVLRLFCISNNVSMQERIAVHP